MAISKEAYQALESIVGADNITDEPATLDAYAYQFWAEFRRDGSKFMPRPVAVLLPGSTEEVQAIVKTCNRYRIKYKPYATGWGLHAAPLQEDTIQLDLRRMDKIIEIDEKNMFAVIEPCVIGSTLQAEAMKVGLNTHMIGAGGSCSPLAAATSYYGIGPDSIFMGSSPENLLEAEWVMPNGDIMRTGSLGAGAGWFCGDGPGPSLRGAFRGALGAAGGLGVFTRCAIKLYPWTGPAVMPIEGTPPVYVTPLPKNITGHTVAWSTWQGCADALHKIYDNDLGYIAHRQFIMFGDELQGPVLKMVIDPDKTTDHIEEYINSEECTKLSKEMYRSFQLILMGMTIRDIEYQEKVLDQILADTGGWKVATMEEPIMNQWLLLYLIKLCYKSLNWIYGTGWGDSMIRAGTPEFVASGWMERMKEQKRKFGKTGLIIDEGGDAGMGAMGSLGGGGYCGFENFAHYDPADRESVRAAWNCAEEARRRARDVVTGLYSYFWIGDEKRVREDIGRIPHPLIYRYQRKIKEALDPNDVGDASYLWLTDEEIEAASKPTKQG